MRILYIVTAYPRWPGDVITPWLTETIDRLAARGVEVEVLAPSYRGLGDQLADTVRVHRFRYAPAPLETLSHDQTVPDRIRERPWYLALLPGYLAAGSIAAARLVRRRRFDCVHAFWPIPHGLFGLAARSSGGPPLVSTFFGVELTWLRHQFPFLAPIARRIIRRSDAVTVISSYTAARVLELAPGTRVEVIPFGAAVEPGGPPEPTPTTTPPERPFHLLFVGRLVERKGVVVLLRALASLRERVPVRLTVVGDGPLAPALREEAERLGITDSVEFTGFVPEAELARWFESCDAFVLPAIRDSKGDVEGLGVVLLEAMSHGRPVIASASGGIPDIVEHEVTGLLAPPGDVDALAGEIARLSADRDLRRRLVAGARDRLARRFSWDRIIDDLCQVYSDVVSRRPAHATPVRAVDR